MIGFEVAAAFAEARPTINDEESAWGWTLPTAGDGDVVASTPQPAVWIETVSSPAAITPRSSWSPYDDPADSDDAGGWSNEKK